MRSKKSNHTRGKGTPGSRGHGEDGSEKQMGDMKELKRLSKTQGKKKVWVPDPNAKERAAFPSNFSELRRDVKDNFCYRIPRTVPGPNGEDVPMPRQLLEKRKKKPKRLNRVIPQAYTVVVPGQPDIDAGVDGWIIPNDTDQFVIRGNRMDSLLETFSRVGSKIFYDMDASGEKVETERIPYVKNWWAESSKLEDHGSGGAEMVKTNATTISMRDTVGVSPGISRALQRMIEDGFVEEARQAAEATMEPFGRFYEGLYRGPKTNAKLTSMVGHAALLPELPAGHFHFDHWVNPTYLAEAETGVNREIVPVRCWDAKATCHFGPGPGVTFWMRHLDALGDLTELAKTEPEAAERASYTKMLCEQAMSDCRKRAEVAHKKALAEKSKVEAKGGTYKDWIRPPDDYARDVRIHRELDRIFSEAIRNLGLDKDYVAIGMAEYKEHLIEAYKAGETGIRMDTPEDLAQVARVAERAEKRAREEREAAETALAAVRLEKLELERLRDEVSALRADIDIDAEAAKASRAAAELAEKSASTVLAAAEEAARTKSESILAAARKIEKDVQVLMGAIPAKEDAATLRGVKAAFAAVCPGREPTTNTTEEIVVEIQNEIKKVRTATLAKAELLGVQAAFTAVLPGKEPAAKTAAEIVVEIQQGIQEGQSVAMAEAKLGGVKAAYAAILPGREPTTETVGQIVAEIQTGIREVRTAALAEAEREGVIAAYRAVLPGREPADGKAAEIVLAIQAGIQEVKTAAMGEIVEKQAVLDVREKKLGELTRKANLWDRAEGLIKRVFELFPDTEQQKIKEYASSDSGKLSTAKLTFWMKAFSRLAVMAGIVKGKEPKI